MTSQQKKHIVSLSAISIVGWGSFYLVISELEPCSAPGELVMCGSVSPLNLALFFLSVMLTLIGTLTLLGIILRLWLHPTELPRQQMGIALRQSILLTVTAVGCLLLLLLQALTWWSGLLFLSVVALFEWYLVSSAPGGE